VSSASATTIPRDAGRSLFVYNLFFPLVFIALLPGFMLRMLRRGGFRKYFGERFARYDEEKRSRLQNGPRIWIHSISVGETLVALKLARALHEQDPLSHVAISVTTSTGFAIAMNARESWSDVIYNPLDTRSIVAAALDAIRPLQLIFVEGEIWPNLLAECVRRGIPTSLVDARLSPRSEARFRRFHRWTSPIFRLLERIHVTQRDDIERWVALGIDPTRIRQVGSIKFDDPLVTSSSCADEFRTLLRGRAIADEAPIVIGGSTWDPEEATLAQVTAALRKRFPALLLIVVPRHVERTADILRKLAAAGVRAMRRTELGRSTPTNSPRDSAAFDVLVVDTTGELRDWYELGTIVFVGKSLVAHGGQNPAEPAALGKPILFGPHMENFAALAEHLMRERAAVQVTGEIELRREIESLLENEAMRRERGERAKAALAPHRGATRRTAALLLGR
jgi:3-deoxy-D-manno-octulosonic-acid transferase